MIVRGGSDGFRACEASSRQASADRVKRNRGNRREKPESAAPERTPKQVHKSYPAPARKGGIGTQGTTEAKPKNAVLSEISAPCVRVRPGAEEAEKPEYPRQGPLNRCLSPEKQWFSEGWSSNRTLFLRRPSPLAETRWEMRPRRWPRRTRTGAKPPRSADACLSAIGRSIPRAILRCGSR
jgi:hypothetical protein